MSTTPDRHAQPEPVADHEITSGARGMDLIPAWDDIPDEFKNGGRGHAAKWMQFQSTWFYGGLDGSTLHPRAGVDKDAAMRHLSAIQSSRDPRHVHKIAGVAYLASLWFDHWEPAPAPVPPEPGPWRR